MLGDLFRFAGGLVGSIIGVPLGIIASALSLPLAAVEAAINAGCETTEEIKDWCDEFWDG